MGGTKDAVYWFNSRVSVKRLKRSGDLKKKEGKKKCNLVFSLIFFFCF